jgi:hypothetical protein
VCTCMNAGRGSVWNCLYLSRGLVPLSLISLRSASDSPRLSPNESEALRREISERGTKPRDKYKQFQTEPLPRSGGRLDPRLSPKDFLFCFPKAIVGQGSNGVQSTKYIWCTYSDQ